MTVPTPIYDPRDAAAVRAETIRELRLEVPELSQTQPDQATAALVGVFGRFCEIVIERLNRVPDKNLLAFLDLLGLARQPPQPARVPVTFQLAPGSLSDAVVPAGTQIAAPAAEGEQNPVVFETERELTAVPVTLKTLIATDAARDMVANHSALLADPSTSGARFFAGDRFSEHVLYIGHAELGIPNVTSVQLNFTLHANPGEPLVEPETLSARELVWESWDGESWRAIDPADIEGQETLLGLFNFRHRQSTPALTIGGITSSWMRCRLPRPISPGADPAEGMTPETALPSIEGILITVDAGRSLFTPDAVVVNGEEVDVTKPFYPFGERPKLGDVMYIASREAFSRPSRVVLRVPVVNPSAPLGPGNPPAILPVRASDDVSLRFEVWDGAEWRVLGTSAPGGDRFVIDRTRSFTTASSPEIEIQLEQAALTTVNGMTNYWIRVAIVRGNYGIDSRVRTDNTQPGGVRVDPATFAPPVLESIAVSYTKLLLDDDGAQAVAYNNLEFDNLRPRFDNSEVVMPFRALPDLPPALYMAFTLPPARKQFPMRAISLYHGLKLQDYGERVTPLDRDASIVEQAAPGDDVEHRFVLTNTSAQRVDYRFAVLGGTWARHLSRDTASLAPGEDVTIVVTVRVPNAANLPAGPATDSGFLTVATASSTISARFETRVGDAPARRRSVRWEYWNGNGWATLPVLDTTSALTRSGIVEFFGPSDIAPAKHFETDGYWLRALCEPGEETIEPRLRMLMPNTTFASQNTTVRNEVLGSSDATASQRFKTTRSPVLLSPQLEVRELEPLSRDEVWVPWIEVPDLYASGPEDRHYALDHVTGQVTFGNGAQGRVPPRGVANIRMARYRTGGGGSGNKLAGTIVQMKSTVPYVSAVSNPEAAAGGFAAEEMSAVISRGPRTLRHGDRAVAPEDYEDLARLASSEVARAKCVPLRLLEGDPLGIAIEAGAVSVIVVPDTADPKPVPSVELLRRVSDFLRTRQAVNADVDVVGPLYVRVDVRVEVVLSKLEGSSQVDAAIRARLAEFLHPLTGGRDSTGWDFGRRPQLSDLHAVIGGVPGVSHIRKLNMAQAEDLKRAIGTGRFLVYSGQHQVILTFAGSQ